MKKLISAVLAVLVLYFGNAILGKTLDVQMGENVVVDVQGKLEVYRDGKWKKLKASKSFKAGDRIRSTGDAMTELQFLDGSFVRLDQGAELNIVAAETVDTIYDTEVSVDVMEGRAWFFVPALSSYNSSFRVTSGDVSFDVLGTSFMVDRSEGQVKVSTVNHAIAVEAETAESRLDTLLVSGQELVVRDDLTLKHGNISHNDREEVFFRLNDQKDKKYLDTLDKQWDKNVKKVAGVLPGHYLYSSKRGFETVWSQIGSKESQLEKSLKYANRRLMEAITLARRGQVGTAKDYIALYENAMDDILARMEQGNYPNNAKLQEAWAMLGVKIADNIGVSVDEAELREAIYRQADELVPADKKDALTDFLARRMLYRAFDFDEDGFGSEANDAYGIYYNLSSEIFLTEKTENIDAMIDHLLLFELMSDSLSPALDQQFASLRVEYLANLARSLSKLEAAEQIRISRDFLDQLSVNASYSEKYLLLKELDRDSELNISQVIAEIKQELFEEVRSEYASIATPEERKSYISSLYYSFNQNEMLMEEFITTFKYGLSADLASELDVMARGTVYIPPKALPLLDELKAELSQTNYDLFIEDLRYRALSETEIVNFIERRLEQEQGKSRFKERVNIIYVEDGEEKQASVPYLKSNVLKGKEFEPIPDPVAPPVEELITEEAEIVSEVITE